MQHHFSTTGIKVYWWADCCSSTSAWPLALARITESILPVFHTWRHGRYMMMWERHWYRPNIPRSVRDWLLSCTTKQVLWAVLMTQEGNYSARRIEQWTNCCPPRMCYYSMPDTQCINSVIFQFKIQFSFSYRFMCYRFFSVSIVFQFWKSFRFSFSCQFSNHVYFSFS